MSIKGIVTGQQVQRYRLERAMQFRREMTEAETILWSVLKADQLGYHFRCQQVIGPFLADFYCHQAALVVEVDGLVHAGQQRMDAARDEWLAARGLMVMRVANEEVFDDLNRVCRQIRDVCGQRIKAVVLAPARE